MESPQGAAKGRPEGRPLNRRHIRPSAVDHHEVFELIAVLLVLQQDGEHHGAHVRNGHGFVLLPCEGCIAVHVELHARELGYLPAAVELEVHLYRLLVGSRRP